MKDGSGEKNFFFHTSGKKWIYTKRPAFCQREAKSSKVVSSIPKHFILVVELILLSRINVLILMNKLSNLVKSLRNIRRRHYEK